MYSGFVKFNLFLYILTVGLFMSPCYIYAQETRLYF